MNFLELLQTQTDKVTLNEMILVKKHLPDRVKRPVPACMYIETSTDELAEVRANHKVLLDAVDSFLADKSKKTSLSEVVEALTVQDSVTELDYEVFNLLCWIIARREKPEIALEDIGDKIGLNDIAGVNAITKEVIYFYTSHTRESIEETYETPEVSETPSANPTPSETSSET